MIRLFNMPLTEIPTVWLDVETTGVTPGKDAIVQVGASHFEPGALTAPTTRVWMVNPGIPIPPEATEVHGITDEMVADAPPLRGLLPDLETVCLDAQLGAYNASFDRAFLLPVLMDHTWPWLDALTLVRRIDRYARGKGRHKLEAACQRHGIQLTSAHDAGHDAEAAGRLFHKLVETNRGLVPETLGDALRWFEVQRAEEWHRFHEWLSQQPAREAS